MAYTGSQVIIPFGGVGLLTDDVISSLPMNSLLRANNVEFESGRISKQRGTTKYTTSALSDDIVALYDYWPTPSTQRLIALTADGKMFRDTGDGTFSSQTAIKTGLGTLTTDAHMAVGGAESQSRNKKLFAFMDSAQVQILDGDSSTPRAINFPSQDWQSGNYPTFGIVYQNRMVVLGSAADRHRLYCSTVSDHENFTGQNFPTSRWELWRRVAATPNVDATATIQAGTAVDIFTTTNNDGFLVYGVQPFNKLTIVVSQASTGSPVYTYEYWNGSAWTALTLSTTPNYSTTGSKIAEFTIPSNWAVGDGTEGGGNNNYYAIRVLATTAPSTAVKATSLTVTNTSYDTAPATFPIYPGEGDGLIAACIYKGLLFLFKEPFGCYILDGRDPDSANWQVKVYSDAFGLSSPHGVLTVLGDMLAANSNGSITSLQASDTFGDFDAGDLLSLGKIEQYYRDAFAFSGVPYTHAIYYPEKRTAYFSGRLTGSNEQNAILSINVGGSPPKFSVITKDSPNCLALRKDAQGILRPIYGTTTGHVYFMDRPTYNVDGNAFLGEFQTNYTDLAQVDQSLAGKNKLFDFIEVGYTAVDNSIFYCDVYIDGELRDTKAFDTFFGTELDVFELDTDVLAGDTISSRNRVRLHSCTGNKISLRFYSNEDNGAFRIDKVILNFRLSAEQLYVNQIV